MNDAGIPMHCSVKKSRASISKPFTPEDCETIRRYAVGNGNSIAVKRNKLCVIHSTCILFTNRK